MLLGPSRTFLDGSWVKTWKSKQSQQIVKQTHTGNQTSKNTSVARANRPQSSLFAQSTHHSMENCFVRLFICMLHTPFSYALCVRLFRTPFSYVFSIRLILLYYYIIILWFYYNVLLLYYNIIILLTIFLYCYMII